jgi:aryl-alcohol dehydrogenase-like predicted oxidoreductase
MIGAWSRVGLGCGPLGAMEERDALELVHAALAMGVTLFDTAPSYGASESHLGRALRGRDAVIVTKGGYGVPGCADWTPECIERGVERAVSLLGRVSVFVLHSCGQRDDLIEPLARARDAGRVEAIGYSGDGEGLAWAARVDAFDVLECSVNLFDQDALRYVGRGKRVLAKRALGNAPWLSARRPERLDRAVYWDRMKALFDVPPTVETAMRFVVHSGVDCALVGTRSETHLAEAIEAAGKGPLTNASQLRAAYGEVGSAWRGVV